MSEELKEVKQLITALDEKFSKRFDHMETMVSSLIEIVGATNNKVDSLTETVKELTSKVDSIAADLQVTKKDVDRVFDVTARHEREIGRLQQ